MADFVNFQHVLGKSDHEVLEEILLMRQLAIVLIRKMGFTAFERVRLQANEEYIASQMLDAGVPEETVRRAREEAGKKIREHYDLTGEFDDCVSRQDVLDIVKDIFEGVKEGELNTDVDRLHEAVESFIEELPPTKPNGAWISTKEQLPNKYDLGDGKWLTEKCIATVEIQNLEEGMVYHEIVIGKFVSITDGSGEPFAVFQYESKTSLLPRSVHFFFVDENCTFVPEKSRRFRNEKVNEYYKNMIVSVTAWKPIPDPFVS